MRRDDALVPLSMDNPWELLLNEKSQSHTKKQLTSLIPFLWHVPNRQIRRDKVGEWSPWAGGSDCSWAVLKSANPGLTVSTAQLYGYTKTPSYTLSLGESCTYIENWNKSLNEGVKIRVSLTEREDGAGSFSCQWHLQCWILSHQREWYVSGVESGSPSSPPTCHLPSETLRVTHGRWPDQAASSTVLM